MLSHEEIEAAGEGGVPETPPVLEQFKEQVDTYEKIYSEVEQFEVRREAWVRIFFPKDLHVHVAVIAERLSARQVILQFGD